LDFKFEALLFPVVVFQVSIRNSFPRANEICNKTIKKYTFTKRKKIYHHPHSQKEKERKNKKRKEKSEIIDD